MKTFVLICSSILMLASPALMNGQSAAAPQSAAQTPANSTPAAVKMQIRNVDFHFSENIVVHIAALDGKMSPVGSGMPVFDDKNSFALDVDSGDTTVSMAALASDMNDYVFAVPGSPIKRQVSDDRSSGKERRDSF
jgi:hypothetical protein